MGHPVKQSMYHQNIWGKGKNMSSEKLVPLFTTNNFDEVTQISDVDCDFPFLLLRNKISLCPRPCTTTSTETMQTSIEQLNYDSRGIYIDFDNSVLVTRVKVDNFQMMESLNFLGSNLGLWPGLGIFQLIQWSFKNIALGTLFQKCIRRENTQKTN